jgi:hypothetical protein
MQPLPKACTDHDVQHFSTLVISVFLVILQMFVRRHIFLLSLTVVVTAFAAEDKRLKRGRRDVVVQYSLEHIPVSWDQAGRLLGKREGAFPDKDVGGLFIQWLLLLFSSHGPEADEAAS